MQTFPNLLNHAPVFEYRGQIFLSCICIKTWELYIIHFDREFVGKETGQHMSKEKGCGKRCQK